MTQTVADIVEHSSYETLQEQTFEKLTANASIILAATEAQGKTVADANALYQQENEKLRQLKDTLNRMKEVISQKLAKI